MGLLKVVILNDDKDLEKAYSIFIELRPHLDLATFKSLFHKMSRHSDYQLVGLEKNQELLALMGFRTLCDFVRGTHLYIDDLVTSSAVQRQGFGTQLLNYADQIARSRGCKTLRLCTGIENTGAMGFYEQQGWRKSACAYTKKISAD